MVSRAGFEPMTHSLTGKIPPGFMSTHPSPENRKKKLKTGLVKLL